MDPHGELVHLPDEGRCGAIFAVAPSTRTLGPSGTVVREKLAKGDELPD